MRSSTVNGQEKPGILKMAAQVNNPHTLTGSSQYQSGQLVGQSGGQPADQSGQVPSATQDEMKRALNRVLNSKHFVHAPMKQKFLRLTCDFHLNGRGSELNEYLIGREVFDRDDSYNPATDTIVRVGAHGVRVKLELYYQRGGEDDEIRIEIPVGSYEPVFIKTGQALPAEAAIALSAGVDVGRQLPAEIGVEPATGGSKQRAAGKKILAPMQIAVAALSAAVIVLLIMVLGQRGQVEGHALAV